MCLQRQPSFFAVFGVQGGGTEILHKFTEESELGLCKGAAAEVTVTSTIGKSYNLSCHTEQTWLQGLAGISSSQCICEKVKKCCGQVAKTQTGTNQKRKEMEHGRASKPTSIATSTMTIHAK